MKNLITKIFSRSHQLIIGGDPGPNMKKFAKNISISFIGGIGAFTILFFVSIFAARVLGPEEYGKYSVFFSIAQLLSLLFVLELDVSALYFLAGKKVEQKNQITSSIANMFFVNVVIFSFLALSIYQFFDFQNISRTVFCGALGMAFVFAFKRMIDAFLRAEEKFKTQSLLRVIEAVFVVIAIIVIFSILEYKTFFGYAASVIFGGAVFGFSGLFLIRNVFLHHGWYPKKINEIFQYNSYGLINAFINGFVKNTDKILIASLLGLSAAGLYTVYFTASVTIGARVTQIFVNVFFPSVRSNVKNIKNIYKKINKVFVRFFVPLFLCASAGVAIIVLLYGSEYEFVWPWTVLGGLYIAVHFFASLYGWLLSSISKKGYKFYNVSFIYGAVAYGAILFLSLVFDFFSLTIFFVALILYRMVSGVFSFFTVRDHI